MLETKKQKTRFAHGTGRPNENTHISVERAPFQMRSRQSSHPREAQVFPPAPSTIPTTRPSRPAAKAISPRRPTGSELTT